MAETEPVEVGAELPTLTCPSCGDKVDGVTDSLGVVTGETHSKCFKAPTKADLKEAASESSVPAETGVEGAERG